MREAQLLRRVRSPHVVRRARHRRARRRPALLRHGARDGGVLSDRIGPDGAVDADGLRGDHRGARRRARRAPRGRHHPSRRQAGEPARHRRRPRPTPRRRACDRGLLVPGERIVVGDLGLAKDQDRTAVGPTIVGGTPHFRAPEQTRRGADDRPADRRLRRDRRRLEPADRRAAAGRATTSSPSSPRCPPAWHEFFTRGLAAEPDERFPTMAEWEAAALAALERGDRRSRRLGFRAAAPGATCPYKGLAPYQPEDAAFFFGREALVDELVAPAAVVAHARRRWSVGEREVVVAARRARSRARRGRAAGQPGLDGAPVQSRARRARRARAPARPARHPTASAPCRRPARAIRASARRRASRPGTRVLLAIDQFEELFTHDTNAGRSRRRSSTCSPRSPRRRTRTVRVVLALRADFYADVRPLPVARRAHQRQPDPGRADAAPRAAARDRRTGARAPGFGSRPASSTPILDEAGDEPGALPLVAHALMETWLRRRGTLLDARRVPRGRRRGRRHRAVGRAGLRPPRRRRARRGPAAAPAARRSRARTRPTPGAASPGTRSATDAATARRHRHARRPSAS